MTVKNTPANTSKPRVIFILGMHRSGTSMTAQLVANWGAYMGDELMQADAYNNDGYWEYNPLILLHNRMLMETGNKWLAPASEINTELLLKKYRGEALELIHRMDIMGKTWCWKDPRLPLFLDFWFNLLTNREMIFIIVHRNPAAIADSLRHRDNLPVSLTVALWEYTYLTIFRHLADHRIYHFLNYDRLIKHTEDEFTKLHHFLDKFSPETPVPGKPFTWTGVVKTHLDHSRTDVLIDLSPEQQKLSKIFLQRKIPTPFSISQEKQLRLLSIFTMARDFRLGDIHSQRFAQLFFQTDDQGFSEKNSIYSLNPGICETFHFAFPETQALKSLRFDPLNNYVRIRLLFIQLIRNNKTQRIPLQITSNACWSNDHEYLFDTLDPQLTIRFEGYSTVHADTITISLAYLEKGSEALLSAIGVKEKTHQETIEKNAVVVTLHEQTILEQQEVINKLNDSALQLRKTIEVINEDQNNLKQLVQNSQRTLFYKIYRSAESVKRFVYISGSYKNIRKEIRMIRHTRIIRKSGMFDEAYYYKENPEIIFKGLSPVRHYLEYGGFENRKPSEFFDSADYLLRNPDVAAMNINPLLHFLRFGIDENRQGGIVKESARLEELIRRKIVPLWIMRSKHLFSLIQGNSEVRLIRESRFFDAGYYLRVNADVQAGHIKPEEHYFKYGWKEGRNPGPQFDTAYYLTTYDDVRLQMVNPLLHFIKHGEKEGRLPKPFEYDEVLCQEDAEIVEISSQEYGIENWKIAVVCHLYHIDLADEFLGYFHQMPCQFDLYISTSANDVSFLKDFFSKALPEVSTVVFTLTNQGRDVLPFIHLLSEKLLNYDLVCKVHSKKSSHDKNLEEWRRYLLDQLLGNRKVIARIITMFQQEAQLGLVWPLPHPYLKHLGIDRGWGPTAGREANRQSAIRFFSDFPVPGLDEQFAFPAGNMYWCRPKALKYLAKKGFMPKDYGQEQKQVDCTLSHAIERLTGLIAQQAGFTSKTLFFTRHEINSYRVARVDFPEGRKRILFIAHDLFRAGAEMVLLHILNWMNLHTNHELIVLAMKKGHDGGKLLAEYQRASKVYILADLLTDHTEENAIAKLASQIGKIDLIYGNTVIAATIYPWLGIFGAPVITHIHELEESIRRYSTAKIMTNMKKISSAYIPCSLPVKDNLINRHGINPDRLFRVDEFILPDPNPLPDKNIQRRKSGLPSEKVIIWGCGTIYWRKGTDLFIETAGILKNKGLENFLFCWIGSNLWDIDAKEWGTWHRQEERIAELSLEETVVFMGEKERPKEFFKAGDIYFLPSREDPYPLVCLEAAECGLPLVCFAEAGGIPDFVGEDAGEVVSITDLTKAAEAIAFLVSDEKRRLEKGDQARKKLLQLHTDDIAVPAILEICRNTMQVPPVVSVIVPIYNHAPYLRQRIDSILKQQFRDVEVILLDDASTDDSIAIANEYLSHPAVRLVQNEINSGSPFRQWQKGISRAKGSLIWIAEGDDSAGPEFLTTLIPAFNDEKVVMAYCSSHCMDESGVVSRNHYLRTGHYEGLGFPGERWLEDYIAEGSEEIKHALAVRNTIPNASAALFRRSAFDSVDFSETDSLKTAGDWRIYLSILRDGRLAYFHQHLNNHRIRSKSVVGSNKAEARNTLPDYFKIHRYLLQEFDIPDVVQELMVNSVRINLRKLWPMLSDEEFGELYDTELIIKRK